MLSVQIDQYIHTTLSLSWNLAKLREAANCINEVSSLLAGNEIEPAAREKLLTVRSALGSLSSTGIFSKSQHSELSDIPGDLQRIGIYTCYCFQWAIFDRFVISRVFQAVDGGLLSEDVSARLRRKKNNTKDFLKLLHDGAIQERTPFWHILPWPGPNKDLLEVDYSDLTRIREIRNKYVHSVNEDMLKEISSEDFNTYKKDMWILRLFAQNVDQDCWRLRENQA